MLIFKYEENLIITIPVHFSEFASATIVNQDYWHIVFTRLICRSNVYKSHYFVIGSRYLGTLNCENLYSPLKL